MEILFWIVSIALVLFEFSAGIGKVIGVEMATEWVSRLKLNITFAKAFGGLELGATGVIVSSLFGGGQNIVVLGAILLLIVLKVLELILQAINKEPFKAMVGPILVIVLTTAFFFLRG